MGARELALEVVGLEKRYPKNPVPAVDGVSFSVERGEIFGLLGPNGAGKTTTVGVLTTRVRPTGGSARVVGVDVVADPVGARRHIAVVPQRNNLDRGLSIRQNLLFHARYHGVSARVASARADELLAQFGLLERSNEKVDLFSGGQNQRAMIARALMHSPDVLFLDEPSTGLDPAARLFVWDRIAELRAAGVTILLTTHDMEEAAALTDRVGIMDRGHLLALDTPDALTRALPGSSTIEIAVELEKGDDLPAVLSALDELDGVERVEHLGANERASMLSSTERRARLRLYLSADPAPMLAPMTGVLATRAARLEDVHLGAPSLEDVFIALTGRMLR